ncbi:YncE family protein [Mycobacterium sp. TJFP1]
MTQPMAGEMPFETGQPVRPVFDIKSAISPLRWIFWGALICLVDLTYSQTVDGDGWKFDFANDAAGTLMILWGTTRLAKFRVNDRYRAAMGFVTIAAVLSLLDAIHGHFIYDTAAAVALFFALVGVAAMIATAVFCVAMRWLSEAAGLARSAKSWKTTTWLFVIIYLIPLGLLYCASAVAIALRSPFNIDLGPTGLLLVPVFCVPLIHFFISTNRMKADAQSPAPPPQPRTGEPSRTGKHPLVPILAVAGAAAVVGLFALLYWSQPRNPVTATVDIGNGPYAVAVDPGTHTVYVTNTEDNTVSVIDGTTHTVTATVPVGKHPISVAVDPNAHTVYVVNYNDFNISVIDQATNTVTATMRDPLGLVPRSVAVDPGTQTVYVANLRSDSVSVFDGKTRTVTARIDVGSRPLGVAVDPDSHTIYVANNGEDSVSVIDGSTNTVTDTVDVGAIRDVNPIAVDPDTHTVYVANAADTMTVMDGSTNSVTATVDVGNGPNGVAVDPGTQTVYAVTSTDVMSVIDGSTNTVTATVRVGAWPAGVAVDPGTHSVYVVNNSEHSVSVIEPPFES